MRVSSAVYAYTFEMFQSFFDKSVCIDVVVFRVNRESILHGQLDCFSDFE